MVHLKLILDEEKLVSKYRKFANENMSKKSKSIKYLYQDKQIWYQTVRNN